MPLTTIRGLENNRTGFPHPTARFTAFFASICRQGGRRRCVEETAVAASSIEMIVGVATEMDAEAGTGSLTVE